MSFTFLCECARDFRAIGSPIPTLGMAVRLMVRQAGVKEGDIVADAGAGTGVIAIEAARKVGPSGHVIAVEMNENLCTKARKRIASADLENRITLIQGDAFKLREYLSDLDERAERFDSVLSTVPVSYMPDPTSYIKSLYDATKPGGTVVQETHFAQKVRHLFREVGLQSIHSAFTIITFAPGAVVSGTVPKEDKVSDQR
ncbi:MAG: class I SAM-dependent methyltransferase [Candidatus Undinarchaeales archaeon]|nr:class I SAM-dependent methyltransferase [Candidatus Undinarchaeales archaeon]